MDKYNNFLETLDRLKSAVDKMSEASTREEVENLELETKDYFRALMVKFPYIQSDIHNHALENIGRIAEEDAKEILKR